MLVGAEGFLHLLAHFYIRPVYWYFVNVNISTCV